MVARFTRIVAYEIHAGINGAHRDERVGLWQKRTASTVNDRDPDKLVFLLAENQVAFVDIVANAGVENATPAWIGPFFEERGRAACDDPARCHGWVAPRPEPGVHDSVPEPEPPAPEPPAPGPGPEPPAVLGELLGLGYALVEALGNLSDEVEALNTRIDKLERDGVRVKLR
jgi:hypothetical protein